MLSRGIEALGLGVSAKAQESMMRHLELLARWNRRINLTAIRDPAAMVIQHVLDSLAVAPHVHGERVIDIGSGGGFPGLPLALAQPERHFTLLDSRGKRVEFLRHVIATLRLDNARAEHGRVEDYRPAEKFDTLICRAFASLGDILALTESLQLPGSRLLAMKGRAVAEIDALPEALRSRVSVVDLQVPFLDAARQVVIVPFFQEPA